MSEPARPRSWRRAGAMVGGLLALAAVGLVADRRAADAAPALARAAVVSAAPALASAPALVPLATTPSPAASGSASVAPAAPAGTLPDGRVVLNQASEEDLRRLPGIGPSRAQAILALRQRQGGRFKAVADLLRVKGLGRKTLARLAPKMVLDPPPSV